MKYPEFQQYIENMVNQLKDDLIHRCHRLFHSGGVDTSQMNAAMIAFITAVQDETCRLTDLSKRVGITKEVKNLRHF